MNKNEFPSVAYFCMEYGLDADFKIYAGGLGILAGDIIKCAKDNDYPIVAVGIKWKQGYGDQEFDKYGNPYDSYHNNNYDFLIDTNVTVKVQIRDRDVFCKVWKVTKFNNIDLYLLDTDIPENCDRWITGQLYGWFEEERIAQEMVLGIGGVRALRALNIKPDIYHFNEGHADFAGIELIREKMIKNLSFTDALKNTKQEIVFSTHTPIVEGNETHSLSSLKYMGAFNGLTCDQMRRLGGDPFNMTVAGLRMSKISNAVSKLHAVVANNMWKDISDKSQIVGITNGIHIPTWVDENIRKNSDDTEALWNTHILLKNKLISYVSELKGVTLDKNKLLIGFSRRAAPYKRSDLIFSKPEIIEPYLNNKTIQIIFAGKAHPLDDAGKAIVKNLVDMSKKYPNSVIFLENYNINTGKMLTRGCDVWLNNPRRPLEACGTSGMKAAMNGVINVSVMDGWWPEACKDGVNGWKFGNEENIDNSLTPEKINEIDKYDADSLYDVLLNKVVPIYYNDHNKWVQIMKESIESISYEFSCERMLTEYFKLLYLH